MKKWFEESYIDKKTWLIENAGKLKLDPNQLVVLLAIDYFHQCGKECSLEKISHLLGLSVEKVDEAIAELGKKNYLKIEMKNNSIQFNMNGVFREQSVLPDSLPIVNQFEREFGRTLSNAEIQRLVDWTNEYSNDEIEDALREASMYRKMSMSYIEKVLRSRHGNEGNS